MPKTIRCMFSLNAHAWMHIAWVQNICLVWQYFKSWIHWMESHRTWQAMRLESEKIEEVGTCYTVLVEIHWKPSDKCLVCRSLIEKAPLWESTKRRVPTEYSFVGLVIYVWSSYGSQLLSRVRWQKREGDHLVMFCAQKLRIKDNFL